MESLTPKQQLFITAYLSNGMNGCDAARTAGYKGNAVTIKAVAAENLAKPHLRAIIEAEQAKLREHFAERREGLLADVDEVKQEIIAVKSEFPDNANVRLGLIGKRLDAIEKEAKLTGAYIKDAANPSDQTAIAKQVAAELSAMGKTPEYVAEFVRKRYKVEVAELGLIT